MVPTVLLRVLTGAWIPPSAELGRGARLAYGASGCIIHRHAIIGSDCIISAGVVVGGRGDRDEPPDKHPVPVIGNRVQLLAGAKILGKITVGDDAIIGPNAVVIADVPASGVVVSPLGRLLDHNRPQLWQTAD